MWAIIQSGLSVVSGLLSAAARWAAIGFAFMAGKRRAEAKQNKKTLDIKEEQLEIASRATIHRKSLLERMQRRKRK